MQYFSRYREILLSLARPALRQAMGDSSSDSTRDSAPAMTPENPPDDSVLWGVAAAALMLDEDPPFYPRLAEGLRWLARRGRSEDGGSGAMLADPAGHRRAVYYPFVLHLHLAAFGSRYETISVADWGACEEAIPGALDPLRAAENYSEQPPESRIVDVVLWQALGIFEQALLLKRDVDAEWVDSVVHQIASRPGPDGTLHTRLADESIDAWTCRELCGLHALANLALLGRNKSWSRRVEEIAMYHGAHTQPDHVTTQPWALFAFAWSPRMRGFAEQQMHDVQAQGGPGGRRISPVAAMLLADAAHAMARFAN